MILSEIQNEVRTQLDLPDEDDLPTILLNSYIAEGFNHIINREAHWPFLQSTWTVASTADGSPISLPADVGSIDSVVRAPDVLEYVPHSDAEVQFSGDSGTPCMFSVWGDQLWLWPAATTVESFVVRGWRVATDAWVSAAGNTPDTGSERRLDRALVHYACYRAYSQQEDPELSDFYLSSFERTVRAATEAILRPKYHGKMVIGGGRFPVWRRRRGVWQVD